MDHHVAFQAPRDDVAGTNMTIFKIIPGITPYSQGIDLMDQHVNAVLHNLAPETVILLEHEDVYTAGTGYKVDELKNTNNIEVIYTGRGGKFTYHGPGQRVIYPILNLNLRTKDIKKYVKDLENWIISTLSEFKITAFIKEGMIGIWVNDKGQHKKIGAIGVRARKWVTYHGIAVNISTDLSKFEGIIPCGISEYGVTSMKELGVEVSIAEFDKVLMRNFCRINE
jgi:lipoyl(octanoyl) transferase